ncbi:retropepsin-like aspartic protease family protein [Croceicoccus bisphenolivorans]|uniref:retropepsin-like aspartic protease family protein n=1 Tax=Croceicoccus bisphenolivorans TaxID=1783232 RepID=UPI00082A1A20|nr:TIGR02281 family clan AA aspartic protease [Croceicoccus bisphenolivorans]
MADLGEVLQSLPYGDVFAAHPLLLLALVALCFAMVGGAMRNSVPAVGGMLRGLGSFGLVAVLVLTVIDLVRLNPDLALPQLGVPEQIVDGEETHIPLARDGHYWIEAEVNGHPTRFLVDTGASLTAISPETAQAAGIEANEVLGTVRLETANGSAPAQLTSIDTLETGTIAARDLRAVIAPTMNGMNVLGMNFLSKLEKWSVEDGTLILVPHQPRVPRAIS